MTRRRSGRGICCCSGSRTEKCSTPPPCVRTGLRVKAHHLRWHLLIDARSHCVRDRQDRCPVVDPRDRLLLNNLEATLRATGRAGNGTWLCAARQERRGLISAVQRTITSVQAGGSIAKGIRCSPLRRNRASGFLSVPCADRPSWSPHPRGRVDRCVQDRLSPRPQLDVHRSFLATLRARSSGSPAPLRRRMLLQHNRLPNAIPPC